MSFIHSISKLYFFFPRSEKKKKYKGVFFFFPEKVHEAFIQDVVGFSFFSLKVGCVFFFPNFCVFFLCFFFSCKSSHAIHSFDLEAVFFFRRWKKKYSFFIHSIDFASKCEKNELLQEKKNTIPLEEVHCFLAMNRFVS